MLTQQHRFARRLVNPKWQQSYRTHMCGLCHALGDQYGLASRLLTSHEMILLNLLITAQRPAVVEVVSRRCPLNPLHRVATNRDAASEFAAATAVALTKISLDDQVQDSGGSHLVARAARWQLGDRWQTALDRLSYLGFQTENLSRLNERQTHVEQSASSDPAAPTAALSAALFVQTARLANNRDNETSLAIIGAHYGTYLYLLDAYRDLPADVAQGDFNPLRPFVRSTAEGVELSPAGLKWLLTRFEQIDSEIQRHFQQLQLYRDSELLQELLTKPGQQVISHLLAQLNRQAEPTCRTWSRTDMLKAAFFMSPAPLLFADCDCDCDCCDCDCDVNCNPCDCRCCPECDCCDCCCDPCQICECWSKKKKHHRANHH